MARVNSVKNRFLLSEVDDYSAINVPLKTTGRIKVCNGIFNITLNIFSF